MDAQKQARLCELTEKRRKRAMIIEQQKETSERERQQHAMEKTRERQQRLAELEQQNQCKSEALQQKINDKVHKKPCSFLIEEPRNGGGWRLRSEGVTRRTCFIDTHF